MADYHDLIAKAQQADRDRRNAEARKDDEAVAKRQRKIDADNEHRSACCSTWVGRANW